MVRLFEEAESCQLRRRLVVSSLTLAIIVSAVFIIVSYRLSIQFGVDIQRRNTEIEAITLRNLVIEQGRNLSPTTLETRPCEDKLLTQAVDRDVFIQIIEGRTICEYGRLEMAARQEAATVGFQSPHQTSGILQVEDRHFAWASAGSLTESPRLLLIRESHLIQEGLTLIAKRLSITSLLTFWLAIWAAVMIAGVVTRRFEQANRALVDYAVHDQLTGLPNRTHLIQSIGARLDQAYADRGGQNDPGALLLLNLDTLKDLNNSLGQDKGDEIVKLFSQRMQGLLPAGSSFYRYGTNEFIVWINENQEDRLCKLLQYLHEECRQPFKVDDYSFIVTFAIGIAIFPGDGQNLKELLRSADIALRQAERYRHDFHFYNSRSDPDAKLKSALRAQLHQALHDEEFILFFQPKKCLISLKTVGVEALVRWQHPAYGLLSPYLFIDLVEQSGVVNLFSRYVIRQAIVQVRAWLNEGKAVPVAINLSSYNLLDTQLVPYIEMTLKEYGVPANFLEIELTESAAIVDMGLAQEAFSRFHQLGLKVSMDDFGTGMSSLAYLRRLDVDFVKIDRSFISRIEIDPMDRAIVVCLIELCKNLNKQVVAEGVENVEQVELLAAMGCEQAQGFYFSKPLPPDQLQL